MPVILSTQNDYHAIYAGSGKKLLVNRDLTNQILIGPNEGAVYSTNPETSLIDPLGSIAVDGMQDVYAIAVSGTPVLDIIPDASNWAPSPAQVAAQINALGLMKDTTGVSIKGSTDAITPAVGSLPVADWSTSKLAKDTSAVAIKTSTDAITPAVAAQTRPGNTISDDIAIDGAPILHSAGLIYSVSNQVIAAGGSFSTGNIPFIHPGYLIRFTAQMSALSAVPIVEADLTWTFSGAPGSFLAEEKWFLPAGLPSQLRSNGRGVTKGDTLAITFTNGDAVNSVTINVTIVEVSHHITRDDWRSGMGTTYQSSSSGAPIGARGDPNGLFLINEVATIAAAATKTWGIPLYAGELDLYLSGPALASLTWNLTSQDFTLTAVGPIFAAGQFTPTGLQTKILMPRSVTHLQVTNTSGTGQTVSVAGVAQEYAS